MTPWLSRAAGTPGQNGEFLLTSPAPSPMPSPAAGAPVRQTLGAPAAAAPDRAEGGGGAGGGRAGPGEGSASGEQGAGAAGRPIPERTPRSSGAPQPMSSGSPAALARAAEVRAPAPALGLCCARRTVQPWSPFCDVVVLTAFCHNLEGHCATVTLLASGAGLRTHSAVEPGALDAVRMCVVAPAAAAAAYGSRALLAGAPGGPCERARSRSG